MKSTVAAFAAVAFLGLAACNGDDEFEEPLVEEGSEVEVTPAPPPVVTDTMPMDTMGMDMDTMGTDTL